MPLFARNAGSIDSTAPSSPRWPGLRRALVPLALGLALAGCNTTSGVAPAPAEASPATATAAPAASAPTIAVRPTSVGTWFNLGEHAAPWLGGDAPVPASNASVPTRVAGLQREDGHWLAVVVIQQASGSSAPCPLPTSLHVADSGTGGCLRLRRNADFDRWLEQEHPVLDRWIEQNGWSARPRAWVSERIDSAGGVLETHALIDPALIEPTTRNSTDFLAGGRAGLAWAREFALATAAASGGTLNVPAFPFAPQVAPLPEPASAAAPQPTQATQVPAAPAAPQPIKALPVPRPDRG